LFNYQFKTMSVKITTKSKNAFKAAAKKLGISQEIPDFSFMRKDHGLYMLAVYMMITIIEAGKDGKVRDITDHSEWKYENYFRAKNGYKPGSGGGGFSFLGYGFGDDFSYVGARLSFNSSEKGEEMAKEHPDLWEIFMLNVK
jgi:hypothetical protein